MECSGGRAILLNGRNPARPCINMAERIPVDPRRSVGSRSLKAEGRGWPGHYTCQPVTRRYSSLMGRWQSAFELLLSAAPCTEAEPIVMRGGYRFWPGFFVRSRGAHILARHNEWVPQSTAPMLRGQLLNDSSGVRIVGCLRWTMLILWELFWIVSSVLALIFAVDSFVSGDVSGGLFMVSCSAVAGGVAAWDVKRAAAMRAEEEQRLRRGLTEAFAAAHALAVPGTVEAKGSEEARPKSST